VTNYYAFKYQSDYYPNYYFYTRTLVLCMYRAPKLLLDAAPKQLYI